MIASALRAEIEQYATRTRRHNPLFLKAEAGSLTADGVARYLVNIHHLILHTAFYLVRARDRATALGKPVLAAHFDRKIGDEAGHDRWAERDIERVSALLSAPPNRDIVPATRDLITYVTSVIDEDPALLLAYVLLAEQLTVIVGPAWLQLLEERCGIKQSAMTVVGNHAEIDRDHVEQALDQIDDLVGDPRMLPRMRAVLLESMAHFDRFCAEITEERSHDVRASRVDQHVSAA